MACHPECPGWAIFDPGEPCCWLAAIPGDLPEGAVHVERCDDCDAYETDDDAAYQNFHDYDDFFRNDGDGVGRLYAWNPKTDMARRLVEQHAASHRTEG